MPSRSDTDNIRYIRLPHQEDESFALQPSTDAAKTPTDLEAGGKTFDDRDGGDETLSNDSASGRLFLDELTTVLQPPSSHTPSWARRKRIPFYDRWVARRARTDSSGSDQYIRRRKTPRVLRILVRSIAISLMLL